MFDESKDKCTQFFDGDIREKKRKSRIIDAGEGENSLIVKLK
jgi:hypothetical protein